MMNEIVTSVEKSDSESMLCQVRTTYESRDAVNIFLVYSIIAGPHAKMKCRPKEKKEKQIATFLPRTLRKTQLMALFIVAVRGLWEQARA
jgi:hypothetical protein